MNIFYLVSHILLLAINANAAGRHYLRRHTVEAGHEWTLFFLFTSAVCGSCIATDIINIWEL